MYNRSRNIINNSEPKKINEWINRLIGRPVDRSTHNVPYKMFVILFDFVEVSYIFKKKKIHFISSRWDPFHSYTICNSIPFALSCANAFIDYHNFTFVYLIKRKKKLILELNQPVETDRTESLMTRLLLLFLKKERLKRMKKKYDFIFE